VCPGRKFGPKRDKVAGEWRKLHNEELHDLHCTKYFSGDQIVKEICWACSTYGERRGVHRTLGGTRNRPLGIPRSRWENNIKMDL
jgi:hypothetical protein